MTLYERTEQYAVISPKQLQEGYRVFTETLTLHKIGEEDREIVITERHDYVVIAKRSDDNYLVQNPNWIAGDA